MTLLTATLRASERYDFGRRFAHQPDEDQCRAKRIDQRQQSAEGDQESIPEQQAFLPGDTSVYEMRRHSEHEQRWFSDLTHHDREQAERRRGRRIDGSVRPSFLPYVRMTSSGRWPNARSSNVFLFKLVCLGRAGCHTRARGPLDAGHWMIADNLMQVGLDVVQGAHVARLFLHPNQLRVGMLLQSYPASLR